MVKLICVSFGVPLERFFDMPMSYYCQCCSMPIPDEELHGTEAVNAANEKYVAMHGHWLRMYWPDGLYTPEAHKGLADGYVSDERFRAYYEKVAPGAAQFLRDAIHACV